MTINLLQRGENKFSLYTLVSIKFGKLSFYLRVKVNISKGRGGMGLAGQTFTMPSGSCLPISSYISCVSFTIVANSSVSHRRRGSSGVYTRPSPHLLDGVDMFFHELLQLVKSVLCSL